MSCGGIEIGASTHCIVLGKEKVGGSEFMCVFFLFFLFFSRLDFQTVHSLPRLGNVKNKELVDMH